jgi:hypothetical protein
VARRIPMEMGTGTSSTGVGSDLSRKYWTA